MIAKRICTATIFATLIGVFVTSVLVRVPDFLWWCPALGGKQSTSLLMWIDGNILVPVGVIFVAFLVLWCAWRLSANICDKLRGEQ